MSGRNESAADREHVQIDGHRTPPLQHLDLFRLAYVASTFLKVQSVDRVKADLFTAKQA